MVKVPYEKALAEVVQYDDSDVIQTASAFPGYCITQHPGQGNGCFFDLIGWSSGSGDKPTIGD